MLVDGRGVPLSIVVTGANRHDSTQVDAVLWSKVKYPEAEVEENLCADAGYTGKEIKKSMEDFGYTPHVKGRKVEAEAKKQEGFKPRRWVVEACHSWMNNFRKLHVRYEKSKQSYLALCMLAAAIIALNKIGIIYG